MSGSNGVRRRVIILFALIFLLSGCLPAFPTGQAPAPSPTSQSTQLPVFATPTSSGPLRTLTVCLGEEPNTLYPLATLNDAAQSVLAAIDDGPIDTIGYQYQPVILEKLPSLADGDARIVPVSVQPGSKIVDANGTLTSLALGVEVRPASCRSSDCTIIYDGISPIQLDQMQVTFHMRPDLTWSDGTPVVAADSIYAYQLAADPATPNSKVLIDRTQTYEPAGTYQTQWWGIPGYLDSSYQTNFFAPAPKHLWSKYKAAQLPTIDISSRAPAGWGPYTVKDWIEGDHITLVKNQYYFRAAQGYPKFDQLVFRFITDPNAAISELAAGHCDILDPSIRLDSQVDLLLQMQKSGALKASIVPGMAIEWLGLGIVPATYDDGIQTAKGDRPDLLGDPRTRQAIAMCLDRKKVVDTVLYGESKVPLSFVPPDHPVYDATVSAYDFNPQAALQLLQVVGWHDIDGNPATPLSAVSVKGIVAGTALKLNYYTTPALQRRQVVDILTQSLAQCGIGLNVQYYSQNDLYAPGPEGLLFGRRFDMIEYAMATDAVQPPCDWFSSSQIPNANNHWVGTNVTGYNNPQYDAACRGAQLSLPSEPTYKASYAQAQSIFATDIPAIPLYFRLKVAAARPDLCHFSLDPSANPLWNVEAFDNGEGCK